MRFCSCDDLCTHAFLVSQLTRELKKALCSALKFMLNLEEYSLLYRQFHLSEAQIKHFYSTVDAAKTAYGFPLIQ